MLVSVVNSLIGRTDPFTVTVSICLNSFYVWEDSLLCNYPLISSYTAYCLVAASSLDARFTCGDR